MFSFDPIDDQQKRDDAAIERMLADEIHTYHPDTPDTTDDEPDHDYEYESRLRLVRELSCCPEGLTSSEVADIMNGD